MKNILTVCLLFIMVSCAREQSLSELIGIESYISERPEEALAALDSLSSSGDISGREANAKFALLYSIALDKNGIDSADDSLINVAMNWYRRHGSADEKLKAYYCPLEYSKKAEICFQDSGDTDRRTSALLSSAI